MKTFQRPPGAFPSPHEAFRPSHGAIIRVHEGPQRPHEGPWPLHEGLKPAHEALMRAHEAIKRPHEGPWPAHEASRRAPEALKRARGRPFLGGRGAGGGIRAEKVARPSRSCPMPPSPLPLLPSHSAGTALPRSWGRFRDHGGKRCPNTSASPRLRGKRAGWERGEGGKTVSVLSDATLSFAVACFTQRRDGAATFLGVGPGITEGRMSKHLCVSASPQGAVQRRRRGGGIGGSGSFL